MDLEAALPAQPIDRLHLGIEFADVRPLPPAIGAALGYPRGHLPEPVLHAIHQILDEPSSIWSIEGGYVLYPGLTVDREQQGLRVEGVSFEVGKIVCGQLSRSEGVAVFLCTAGCGIEDLAREFASSGDLFMSFIADTVGSLVVELAMDRIEEALARRMEQRGLRITNRYSPGYCGWHVSEQQKLFRLLPPGFCGVSLSDTSLMRPIKTVSGFIGTGHDVRRSPYTCSLCDMQDCLYRRLHEAPAAPCGPERG